MARSMSISVLLADDHAVLRDGLKVLLQAQADIRVVGLAADGREAVATAAQLQPDVVVMDISMPDMNGVEAARRICAARPQTRVVMLSMHADAEHVYRALEAGATGYLLKNSAGSELVAAVRAVHAGRRYLTGQINDMVIAGYVGDKRAESPLDSLSKRERDILQLLVDGRSNREAAELLHISVKTVETYRSRMLQKLGISNMAELMKFALTHGLTQVK
jgi:DNA-binding NarL/FixJ family response regulator